MGKWISKRYDLGYAALFLTPTLLIFGVFVYYALAFNFQISLTSWNFISATKTYIGLDNYARLISDPRFWKVVANTFYYAVGTLAGTMVIGMVLALLLYRPIRGRNFFRAVMFSPYVTTTAAISLLWLWIFYPDGGLFNYLLSFFGVEGPRWLGDVQWAMPALIIMNVWQRSGYAMIIFLSGLVNIPNEFYEAAEMDGAGGLAKFRHITLPLLTPTIFFLTVTSFIGSFQVFDSVAVMTRGGPGDATRVFNYFVYETAFSSLRAGYAAAAASIMFLIIALLTVIQLRGSKAWVHYQ